LARPTHQANGIPSRWKEKRGREKKEKREKGEKENLISKLDSPENEKENGGGHVK